MKKLTKDQAREFLKDKYLKVKSLGEAKKAHDKILSLGFSMAHDHWHANEKPYLTLSGSLDQQTWEFCSMLHNDETELPLSELLSLEITDEPFFVPNGGCEAESKWNKKSTDYKAKFEEAVILLKRVDTIWTPETNMEEELISDIQAFIAANRGV